MGVQGRAIVIFKGAPGREQAAGQSISIWPAAGRAQWRPAAVGGPNRGLRELALQPAGRAPLLRIKSTICAARIRRRPSPARSLVGRPS